MAWNRCTFRHSVPRTAEDFAIRDDIALEHRVHTLGTIISASGIPVRVLRDARNSLLDGERWLRDQLQILDEQELALSIQRDTFSSQDSSADDPEAR